MSNICNICHDATCPCGKVVLRTDAELIDALRACRWILAQKVKSDRWIAVGERLPGSMTGVLIWHFGRVETAMFVTVDVGFCDSRGHYPNDVTHWRPLPAAPEASNG